MFEWIKPGAFTEALAEGPVMCRYNHQLVIGTTKDHLQVWQDAAGAALVTRGRGFRWLVDAVAAATSRSRARSACDMVPHGIEHWGETEFGSLARIVERQQADRREPGHRSRISCRDR